MSQFAVGGLRAIAGAGRGAKPAKFFDYLAGIPIAETLRLAGKGSLPRLNPAVQARSAEGLSRIQLERAIALANKEQQKAYRAAVRAAEKAGKDAPAKPKPITQENFQAPEGGLKFDKDIQQQAEAMLFADHKVQALGAGAFTLGVGGHPFDPSTWSDPAASLSKFRQAQAISAGQMRQSMMTAKFDKLRQDMLRSAARLSAANPQLYEQVLAGRRLPLGATVLGGQPRVDLLQELALGMAQGQFKSSVDPSRAAALSQLVGGM
jgi:hypothetical protein